MTGSWIPVHEGIPDPPQWEVVGDVRGPMGPPGAEVLPYTMTGLLSVRAGTAPFPVAGGPFVIDTVTAMVGAAPTGGPVVVDVLVNASSIYTDAAAKPTIAAGTMRAVVGTPTTVNVAEGDYFTVSVLQVGTIVPGADLTVVIRLLDVAALEGSPDPTDPDVFVTTL